MAIHLHYIRIDCVSPSIASNETTLHKDATHREDTVHGCSSEIHNTVNGTQDMRNESGNKTHPKPIEVVDLVALSETLGEDSISAVSYTHLTLPTKRIV